MSPCCDEASYKASLALTGPVPPPLTAVSNIPVAREEPVTPSLKQVTFAPTPKMSSYLVVLAVGEFERLTAQADGVTVGVVNPLGQSEQGRLALVSAGNLFLYLNDYFCMA